jgi:phage tail sheath protein FI
MPDFLHGIEVTEISDGIRPIRTVRSSVIGLIGDAPLADATAFPLDTPVLVTGPRQAAALGLTGSLLDSYTAIYQQGAAVVVVVRVAGADAAAIQAAAVGDPIAFTGVNAFLRAQELVGLTPRILVAPGLTGDRPLDAANPVITALLPVATRLRAIVVADGPNTDTADALTFAADWGSDRLFIVDPAVRVYDTVAQALETRPASPFAAGAIAASDITRGFWWSPSNTVLAGVSGAARPISFGLSDTQTEANLLNEANVATVVQINGWRLWGNRTTATDTLWTFLSVRRTADIIYDSIEEALLWALDRPASPQLVVDIRDTVQSYLDLLVGRGALLGGRVWFDPELNPVTALQAGQLTLDFDIEPPAPIERLTFRAHRNGDYYETLATALSSTTV